MTQIDVLKMAIEAGLAAETSDGRHQIWYPDNLHHFAKLVAAKEREECAKVCEELPAPNFYSDTDQSMWDITSMDCAEAIRARTKEQK